MDPSRPHCVFEFQANLKREEGKRLFEKKKYVEAISLFSEALADFVRSDYAQAAAVCLTNRSVAYGKLGFWKESYCDAVAARRRHPQYAKAWFRSGVALEHLKIFKTAAADYYKAVERDPNLYAQATAAIERCRTTSIDNKKKDDKRITENGEEEKKTEQEETSFSSSSKEEEGQEKVSLYLNPAWKNWVGDDPLEDKAHGPTQKIWIGLGPGRCGLHSLAALMNQSVRESYAACLQQEQSMPDYRGLIWDPDEDRMDVVKRAVWSLRHMPMFTWGAPFYDVCGDVHYAWLPYVRHILKVAPEMKFVVMVREREDIVKSFFYWTEAGSRRAAPVEQQQQIFVDAPVFAHAKNHWQMHDQSLYDFDDWDLSYPKILDRGFTKRQAIAKYVDDYYSETDKLSQEFPENFKFYDCDSLFKSLKLKRELFDWIGIQEGVIGKPDPSPIFHESKQLYIYDEVADDDEVFDIGDFRRVDPRMPQKDNLLLIKPDSENPGKLGRPRRTLVVPPNSKPGDTLRFSIKGQLKRAVVPDGKLPGDSFSVPLDDDDDAVSEEQKNTPHEEKKKLMIGDWEWEEPPDNFGGIDPFVMPTQDMIDGKEPCDYKYMLPTMHIKPLPEDFDVEAKIKHILSLCKNPIPGIEALKYLNPDTSQHLD